MNLILLLKLPSWCTFTMKLSPVESCTSSQISIVELLWKAVCGIKLRGIEKF